ncbi:hypothetical protein RHMOL_Rhmol12G0180900 [Rhododendron molle]|uniref:Uncharacterized protein n=1 Tax=Rhododendron molle TaxID=49168 RepID=A0ACC0LL30_RHOML|nr:hypothetical protein RHMOL_Rhmol12G0180900 [Rhododendron molle]
MSKNKVGASCVELVFFLILISGTTVTGDTLESDKKALLNLKIFLEEHNRVNQGRYSEWNKSQTLSPCAWPGITCSGGRVTGVNLSSSEISGDIFGNFSALTALNHLDLSSNTIGGRFPTDLGQCHGLKVLNLSHNIISGELNLTRLNNLEILDLATNRFSGAIQLTFPAICSKLVVANLSTNNFTGTTVNGFDSCNNLKFLDLSANSFSGNIWPGFVRLQEFSVSENKLVGPISPDFFSERCGLQVLDLSENSFVGEFPKEISNCGELVILNLWGNNFTGQIPEDIGNISGLQGLYLGSNSFSRDIPESLLGLTNLAFLDLSTNNFRGDMQEIFGKFIQVKFLVLHSNSYTGGIYSSGILNLPNISRLDLSFNNFSGPLPVEISQMKSLKFLILAYNEFYGIIPPEYGNLQSLQALDLSFNKLNGSIPSSLGNLTSLLWLMLANNALTGEIPAELGNCGSLLWLNLANNQLSGKIPPELTNIGLNATPTFEQNRRNDTVTVASGECLVMRRWIPADYPPFSFVYTLLTRKNCQSLWDRLLKGYGLFALCVGGMRTFQMSGYVQLSSNQLSGEVPSDIGKMLKVSMLNLGINGFYGDLPPEIGQMPLAVLNISQNKFSGEIPREIGNIKCLRDLDLSYNNFSGDFPTDLNNLNELRKFNVSFNPYITGVIPATGQLATFEKESFLGNPLLSLPNFINNSADHSPTINDEKKSKREPAKRDSFLVFLALVVVFFFLIGFGGVCGIVTLVVCLTVESPVEMPGYHLGDTNSQHDSISSSSAFSPWISDTVKVIRLDKTAFTHADILKATDNFLDDRIIGRGGSGTVYRGVLLDGREVAVKKLQREGIEGEKEFRAEMEVLSGNSFGWPHPNLVALYGWCLDSFGVLAMELATGRRAVDGGEECLVEWARRVMGNGQKGYLSRSMIPVAILGFGIGEAAEGMRELLKVGVRCTEGMPQARPNMKEVLAMLIQISSCQAHSSCGSSSPPSSHCDEGLN